MGVADDTDLGGGGFLTGDYGFMTASGDLVLVGPRGKTDHRALSELVHAAQRTKRVIRRVIIRRPIPAGTLWIMNQRRWGPYRTARSACEELVLEGDGV